MKVQVDIDVQDVDAALEGLARVYQLVEDGATKDEVVLLNGSVVGVFEILEPAA
jgi:hypothetical protein